MKEQPGRRKKTIMSNIVEVNGLKIGEGMPKICVPVVAENIEEIKKDLKKNLILKKEKITL